MTIFIESTNDITSQHYLHSTDIGDGYDLWVLTGMVRFHISDFDFSRGGEDRVAIRIPIPDVRGDRAVRLRHWTVFGAITGTALEVRRFDLGGFNIVDPKQLDTAIPAFRVAPTRAMDPDGIEGIAYTVHLMGKIEDRAVVRVP